jgi:hypothetical protein
MLQSFGGVEHLLNRYCFYDRTATLSTPTGTLAGVARVATEFNATADDDVFFAIGTTAMMICRSEDGYDRGSNGNCDVHWSRVIADIEIAGCDKSSDLTQIVFFHADRLPAHQFGNFRLQLPLVGSSK